MEIELDPYETRVAYDHGLFDKKEDTFEKKKDVTMVSFGNVLFDDHDKKDNDRDNTIGMFGNGLFDHIGKDEKKEVKEIKKEEFKQKEIKKHDFPYMIKHKKKDAYLVFNHGYHDGENIILIKENETTRRLKVLFEKYLTATNKKQYLKNMIALDESAQLHYQLGKEYSFTSSKKYAREEYKKAYELDPNDGTICKAMALVYFEEKDYQKAYEIINHAIKQCHQSCASRKDALLYAYATKAIIAQKLQKHDLALASLIKAYQYVDNYKSEIHNLSFISLKTEASALNILYNVYNEAIVDNNSKVYHLMIISTVFKIGNNLYKNLIDSELKNHPISLLNKFRNVAFVYTFTNDTIFANKIGLVWNYYYGYLAIYCIHQIGMNVWPYLSYIELSDCEVICLSSKEIILRKNKEYIKLPVSKDYCQLIQNILNKIIDKNKKTLKLLEKE